jgi:hypothetical protein
MGNRTDSIATKTSLQWKESSTDLINSPPICDRIQEKHSVFALRFYRAWGFNGGQCPELTPGHSSQHFRGADFYPAAARGHHPKGVSTEITGA